MTSLSTRWWRVSAQGNDEPRERQDIGKRWRMIQKGVGGKERLRSQGYIGYRSQNTLAIVLGDVSSICFCENLHIRKRIVNYTFFNKWIQTSSISMDYQSNERASWISDKSFYMHKVSVRLSISDLVGRLCIFYSSSSAMSSMTSMSSIWRLFSSGSSSSISSSSSPSSFFSSSSSISSSSSSMSISSS